MYSSSLWRTDTIVVSKLNKPPVSIKLPLKWGGELNRGFMIIRIQESGERFLLDSGILGFGTGIQPKESGNPLTIEIRNPSSTENKSGIQYLDSGIHSVESRIYGCIGLPYIRLHGG